MAIEMVFKFIGKNPSTMLIGGGILFLLLSPVIPPFAALGVVLIAIGILLHALWLRR